MFNEKIKEQPKFRKFESKTPNLAQQLLFQNIFPLANSFPKWENVRRWQAPYGTRIRRIRATFIGVCVRH